MACCRNEVGASRQCLHHDIGTRAATLVAAACRRAWLSVVANAKTTQHRRMRNNVEKSVRWKKGSKGVYSRVSSREIIYMFRQVKVVDMLPCDTKNVH